MAWYAVDYRPLRRGNGHALDVSQISKIFEWRSKGMISRTSSSIVLPMVLLALASVGHVYLILVPFGRGGVTSTSEVSQEIVTCRTEDVMGR
jgi:hypothetical protein